MRYSKQRDVILAVIKDSHEHLSVEKIYSLVKNEINNISLGTVYRNLAQLVDNNYIVQIKGIDNRVYYDKNITIHGHLFCNKCKKVVDTHHDLISDMKHNILNNHKFKIEEYNLSISGICHECQN